MSSTNDAPNVPRVFISHSSQDKPFVRRLADDLRQANYDVWLDEKEVQIGDSIPQKISEGLQSSDFLVIVLSHNSLKSGWAQRELEIALMGQLGGKPIRVMPIRLDETPVPTLLSPILYADFRSDYTQGLNKLVNSLGNKIPTPLPVPAQRAVDREKLIHLLENLTEPLFAQVLVRLPDTRGKISTSAAHMIQVRELIEYADSAIGSDINTVADAVVKAFPNLAEDKIPFR